MKETNLPPLVHILYLDDSADERVLLTAAAHDIPSLCLTTLEGYDALVAYLSEPAAGRSSPISLVLADYRLRGSFDTETVRYIRSHPALKHLPLGMFTSWERPSDISTCYGAGADFYLVKPLTLGRLRSVLFALQQALTSAPPEFGSVVNLQEHRDRTPTPELALAA